MDIYGIVMAGGGGTRFWPLSRKDTPKQLLNLSGRDIMVNEAVSRLTHLTPRENIYIVTNKNQLGRMREAVGDTLPAENFFPEPAARNTAACIGYAAVELVKKRGDGIMVITPSDAYIRDDEVFADILKTAVSAAEDTGKLVTIGIQPTFPATGYGYICFKKTGGEVKEVIRFVEKPSLRRAKKYLASGQYVWNSGIFVWRASVILEKYKKLLPDIYADLMKLQNAIGTEKEKATLERVYPKIGAISVDYGIMEKSRDILVVPGEFGWSDVGSWDMLGTLRTADENGNVIVGDGIGLEAKGNVVYAQDKLVALIGVNDLIVVETPAAVLVCPKKRAQDVKKLVDELKSRGREDVL